MDAPIKLLTLNQLIKSTLENQLEPSYWVIAEIGEIKAGSGGHAYLDLVEKQGNQFLAKIRANIWSYTYRSISASFASDTGQQLRNGMKILAYVTVTFHEVYGISLNIKDIDPNFTLGERAKQRQEVIEKLKTDGILTLNKRFSLPLVPQKIAVISSATAAGYGDFINQLQHNPYGYAVKTTLFQANLQGIGGVSSLLEAITQVEKNHEYFDALVIIRGGGAQMDLDCFDDYDLCVGIGKFPLPVFTGIGHERDETIADMVAHTRLKTPTAVAEFIISGIRNYEEQLLGHLKVMEKAAAQMLFLEDRRLLDSENKIKNKFSNILQLAKEQVKLLQSQLSSQVSGRLKIESQRIINLESRIQTQAKTHLNQSERQLTHLEKSLSQLDPRQLLKRGYTWTEVDGISINNLEPKVGHTLTTYTKDIKIKSTIQNIEEYER
jgi:exodeoxyribonuclease VII large subunit